MKKHEPAVRLTPGQRRELTRRSDWPAIADLLVHSGTIALLIVLIIMRVPFWALLLLPLGIAQVFLFTLMHETTHGTAFKSNWLNTLVNRCCALVIMIPPAWFRFFHLAHHRYTQDTEKDPELSNPKPATLPQYVLHVSGLPTWWSSIRTLVTNASGRSSYDYVPTSQSANVKLEAQWMLGCYFSLLLVSLIFNTTVLLYLWLLPLLVGQPFLRVYLLAEHSGCEHVPDMLRNTRTTLTNWLVRRLAWNMPYHTEHHQMPMVPYFRLADYHRLIRGEVQNLAMGYGRFNGSYVNNLADRYQSVNNNP